MKKLLSILCTLALVLSVVLVPGMFSASAAASDVTFVAFQDATKAYTDTTVDPAVNAFGIPQNTSGSSAWGAPQYMVSDFQLEKDATYVLTYDWRGHNYESPIWISAADKAEAGFAHSGKKIVAAKGSNKNKYMNLGLVFKANDVITDTHKYLAIALQDYGDDAYLLANVKIEKITPSSTYLTPVGFNNNIYAAVDNGEVYFHAYGWYNQSSLVFDYEIEANKYYKLTLDYKGQNRNNDSDSANKLLSVAAVAAKNSGWKEGQNLRIEPIYGANHPDAYKTYEFTFKGADAKAEDTNKYLAIQHGYTYGVFSIKNVKIEEVEAPAGGDEGGEGEGGEGGNEPEDTTPGASAKYPLKDAEFIYPTKLSGDAKESADNVKVYKWDKDHTAEKVNYRPTYGWSDNTAKKGVLVFDETLSENAEYILEFDRWGHYNASDYVKIGTADANGNADFTKSVVETPTYAQQWSSYWHDSINFKANDVINGENKRLAIELSSGASPNLIKNIKLTKVTREKGYQYPEVISCGMNAIAENGKVVYANTDAGDKAWMIFNYKLEAGKTYQVEFDYYGHYNVQAGGWNWAFGAAASLDVATNEKSSLFNDKAKLVGVPYVSNSHTGLKADKGYKHVSVMLNADDVITETNKYFVLHSSGYDSMPFLKNFKIQAFEPSGLLPVTLGRETMISVEDGDVTVGVTVSYSGNSWMKFDYELQPDTEYIFSYDFRGHSYLESDKDTKLSIFAVADPYSTGHPKDAGEINLAKQGPILTISNTKNDFTHKVVTFNSNDVIDGDKKYFTIYGQGYPDKWTIKNLVLIVKPESDGSNLLFNTDFEDKNLDTQFWTNKGTTITRVETENHTEGGSAALNIKGGNYANVNQNAIVEKNTNYELSFWYKGTVGNQTLVGISRDIAEFSRRYMFAQEWAADAEVAEWTKCSITFNTGNREIVNIGFLTTAISNYYIDDVVLAPIDTQGKYSAETTVTEPSITSDNTLIRYQHWTAKDGKNMIENGDFEGEIPASWYDFISGSNGTLSIVDGEGYAGSNTAVGGKALKFKAKGLEEVAGGYIYIDGLKANTNYLLSYWTRAPYWAPDNDADARHGIANTFDGNMYFTFREEIRGHQVLTQDNSWHRTTIQFNTGASTRVAYAISGQNTTFYVDNLQVFALEDRVDARPEVMIDNEFNQAYVTDKAPTKIYVGASKNLVKNGNFEDATSTFWSDDATTIGYKNGGGDEYYNGKYVTILDWNGVAEVKDTGTSRGNALYYEDSSHITGYPLATAYMKYIDVEPNTEYTFVADYVVTKYYDKPVLLDNNGSFKSGDFGIAMVNTWNPHPIASVNFKDNYNSSLAWQQFKVTFNTNGYEQVGIYVRDNGGAAYFDNISLFKTSDGSETPVVEEPDEPGQGGETPTPPPVVVEGKIESNKYTVTGEKGSKTLSGIKAGTTVKEVLDSLENKANVKAFDANGKEITDTSIPVGTGFSFRYMDGFSASDAAVVVVRGDIDGDGFVNEEDMSILLKQIVTIEDDVVTDSQMTVADIDGDGFITSHDVALISMHIGGAKALEPIVVG